MENKKAKRIWTLTSALVLLTVLAFFRTIVHFITESQWFLEVGYLNVFYKILFSKLILIVPVFAVIFAILALYLRFVKHKYIKAAGIAENETGSKKLTRTFFLAVALASALMAYLIANEYWMEILKFWNQTKFNIQDPIFGKDLSFYIFTLPLFRAIYSLAVSILGLLVLVSLGYFGVLYYTNPPAQMAYENVTAGKFGSLLDRFRENKHINILFTIFMVIAALLLLTLAAGFYLDSFELLYSSRGAIYGAGYTDVNVTMWVNRAKMALAILLAILLLLGLKGKNKQKIFLFGTAALLAVTVVGAGIETSVQNLVVSPNELSKEKPYIENNIQYTSLAYGLDKIAVKDFAVDQRLTSKDIQNNQQTITNVSINDERPALEAFNQLQGLRGYYRFYDVDTDRYYVDGQIQQMFLSARELDKDKLDQNAKSWINTKLKYTHGYGMAAAPVNTINKAGQPEMVVKNMPVNSSLKELEITKPQIYYGELTNDYVIIDTAEEEFDYPKGDTNETTEYDGSGGIRLNFLNRILYAIKYNDFKLLISTSIHSDSRILVNRNVIRRVEKIAPFIEFESDVYAVVHEGKIYYITDGYTKSSYYPYSEPYDKEGNNYIRNSVKAVVDAYDGTVAFYIADEKDPIIQTYSKVFDKMFKPLSEIPEGLRAHIRYPKDIFEIQSKMYLTYHATNPNVFYNREDKWAIPNETYQSQEAPMSPLYFTFKLPEEEKAEFLLSIPFTPNGKQTLTGFMVARNDGEHYGEFVLYRFPKDRSIIGPQQIEAQISNNDVISRDLSLWNSQGSEVIRGHLLTIPMENSILYIEPLYIRASSETAIPEVKRIIAAFNSKIVMDTTLEGALKQIFENGGNDFENVFDDETADSQNKDAPIDENNGIIDSPDKPSLDAGEAIKKANELYDQAQEALRKGSLSEYERLINELGNILKELQ